MGPDVPQSFRTKQELSYRIAERSHLPDVMTANASQGMYKCTLRFGVSESNQPSREED